MQLIGIVSVFIVPRLNLKYLTENTWLSRYQRTIKAMEQSWHEECFVCAGPCKKPLVGTSFYERDGRPYCRIDFEQLFAARCAGCTLPITENAIVALNAKWHRDCFKCKVGARLQIEFEPRPDSNQGLQTPRIYTLQYLMMVSYFACRSA